jgi:hypothetical protein
VRFHPNQDSSVYWPPLLNCEITSWESPPRCQVVRPDRPVFGTSGPTLCDAGLKTNAARYVRPVSCYLDTTFRVSWERLSGRHVVRIKDSTR